MKKNTNKKTHINSEISSEDAKIDLLFRRAVEVEIEKKKLLGHPISRYDDKLKKAYMEYPNGERRYAE